MTLNPPPKVRATIYAVTALGTPLIAYLLVKGIVGEAEVALWSAEVTVAAAMAGLNVSTKKEEI